jgi:hypothetical protein
MKNAIAAAINWAAFAVGAPILMAAGGFLLYGLCTESAPNLWHDPSLARFALAAAEVMVGGLLVGAPLSWFDHLPGAETLRRPLGSFFRHG